MKLALFLAMAAAAGAIALGVFELARPRSALAVDLGLVAAVEPALAPAVLSLPLPPPDEQRRVKIAAVEPISAPAAAATEVQDLVPLARLRGRAVDVLGRPIEWFRVEIREEGREEAWIGDTHQSPSPAGAFDAALALEPGAEHPLWLTIEACGFESSSTFLSVTASEQREGILVRLLERIPDVYGSVVDRAGRPIAGARVTALTSLSPAAVEVSSEARLRVYTPADPLPGVAVESIRTDAQGSFALRCSSGAGVAALVVEDAFHPQALFRREDVGDSWYGVRLEVESGGAIRGTVVGEQGEPLEGLRVQACAKDPRTYTRRWLESVSWSADEGRFELRGLPDGELEVCFWRKIAEGRYGYWSSETVQSRDGRLAVCDFRLPRWIGPEPEPPAEASGDDASRPDPHGARGR